jgi:hypothetical protein
VGGRWQAVAEGAEDACRIQGERARGRRIRGGGAATSEAHERDYCADMVEDICSCTIVGTMA